ncbi:AAA domain-containing protein [Pseudomonas sp. DTU12.1]|uniref:AAA domain-containing protein n=1 Tax=Pseudomonas sp. DTU12.1 TaxID=2654238 RepID=UPI00132ECFAC|nr:AAA domain-containing protein [Pseudomonas sp. DTU12.1]QHG23884.1 AAA family ATPase [Pseudomonas sp. DTU12.1]
MQRTPNELLSRLFEYAEESLKELDPSRYQLSSSVNDVYPPTDLLGIPGLHFDLQFPGDNVWLQIERLEESRAPAPVYGSYSSVIKASDNPSKPPLLSEQVLLQLIREQQDKDPGGDIAAVESEVRAQASAALTAHLILWHEWAELEKPRRKTISLYGDMFALMQQMETGKSARELVWGVGVSAWTLTINDAQHGFNYPLLTQALDISLNEESMAVEVRPRATEPMIEFDALINANIPGASECERAIRDHLGRHVDSPLNPFLPSTFADVLKLSARSLDSKGKYLEVMGDGAQAFPEPGDTLQISDAWVVFARPKPSNWLINDLRKIREKLKECLELPAGPLALVTPASNIAIDYQHVNFRGLSSRSMDGSRAEPKELYFPLPYNDEQVTIVQRLEHAPGVAVQGPPGTGKTHTIANIICHYLATGKRVLVTSRGEQALKVLQSKIPAEVRPLTVALLTSDREGIRQFQGSIEAIQHQVSQINPSLARSEIDRLHQSIDLAHTELVRLDRRVNEIALSQLSEIKVGDAKYRAEELAELLMKGGDQYAWFDDELSLSPEHSLPFDDEFGRGLRQARRDLGRDLVYINSSLPEAELLPAAAEIGKLHGSLCQLKSLEYALGQGDLIPLKSDSEAVVTAAKNLDLELGHCEEKLVALHDDGDCEILWSQELRLKAAGGRYDSEISVLIGMLPAAQALMQRRKVMLENFVEFPEEALDCEKTSEAVDRATETGKPFGLMSFGASQAKTHVSNVRINGSAPKSAEQWKIVQDYLKLYADVRSFTARWNPLAETLGIPRLQAGTAHLRQLEITVSTVQAALELTSLYAEKVQPLCDAVFADAPDNMHRLTIVEIRRLRDHLTQNLARLDLSMAGASLAILQAKVAGDSPISCRLRTFILECLGSPDQDTHRVVSQYVDLLTELQRIRELGGLLNYVREGAHRVMTAGAENLSGRLLTVPVENGAEDLAFPSSWKEAWQHAQIRSHLQSIEARHELVELNGKRVKLEAGLARMYREVVSRAAWLSTKANASPMVLQALAGYSTAIRKIGQGTGPNAERYRRDAQQCMQDAAGAVPCWIMSHAKISESMPAEIGAFDLVIVDEASQSDLWALPAIVRAKKVLVVGDDKQVSPDGGFKSGKRIGELRNRFLNDQPYGADMTPDKSLYDLASRVFAGHMVMLREHFRCVPPIISYSNQFYGGAIQPLRIPRPSERLDPPLVDIYVKDGVRNKKGCNRLEAEAIVEEIQALIKDDKYAGRTIGVVTLLGGMEQAKFIDSLVRERCRAVELHAREFACGDASTFQGSERDIIFISMVADPENCHPLSGIAAEQRFNVAASRARDRMYLIRSVTLDHLSLKDVRRTLLEYFSKPLTEQEVDQDGLIKLCESGFEQQVFSRLVERGYRVIPQVKSGAFRLDMVVEGANDNRLAIECDGDAFHGPDRWEADMNRQRILERAGWTFWRCFASSWSMHKEEIFGELLQRLAELGIEPTNALEKLPAVVELREWASAVSTSMEEDDEDIGELTVPPATGEEQQVLTI